MLRHPSPAAPRRPISGRLARLLPALALLVASACSSGSSSGSGADGGAASSGGFTLGVDSAAHAGNLGGFKPASGDVFLVLDVALTNGSVSSALPMNPVLFTVTTAASLVVHASPASAATGTPCRADVGVASGGTAKCALAFEIAASDVAATLGYDDAQGHVASAAIPAAAAPDSCVTVSAWANRFSSACASCETASCKDEIGRASSSACAGAQICMNACKTCPCTEACEQTDACKAALATVYACMATKCTTACQ